ncbi:MAG: XylR N-terminal domain-containing protein [Clostridia bacterium]|nr:XylR N-terminal domain-containing protein [Clostridia bacterium]
MIMKLESLDYFDLLQFRPEEGMITFRGNRMLLFHADSICQLRDELIQSLGKDMARGVLARFGYRSGYRDALSVGNFFDLSTDAEWMLAGPLLHTFEGIVHVTNEVLEFNRQKGSFYMRGIWRNSYEAEQHLKLYGPSKEPVCWSLTGYASGYSSGFMGKEIVCVETKCRAKGDDYCAYELRSAEEWGPEADRYKADLKPTFIVKDLQDIIERKEKKEIKWRTLYEQADEQLQEKVLELQELNKVLSNQHTSLQRSVAIHKQLTGLVLDDFGLDAITKTLAQLVGNPVLVEDYYFKVISSAGTIPAGPNGENPFRSTKEILNDPRYAKLEHSLLKEKRLTSIPVLDEMGFRQQRIVVPILAGGEVMGFVSTFECEKQLEALDLLAMEQAGTVIALELLKQKAAFAAEQQLKEDFLEELLSGTSDEEILETRAMNLGLNPRGAYQVFAVDVDWAYHGGEPGDPDELVAFKKRLVEVINGVVRSTHSKSMVVSKNRFVLIIAALGEGQEDEDSRKIVRLIEEEVKPRLNGYDWWVGVGSQVSRVGEIAKSYREAGTTMEIMKALQRKKKVLLYEQLGIYGVLEINKERFAEFTKRLLGPLMEYDREHNSELVDTLMLYFRNNANLQRAARNGHLNANTLKYRLKRIREIANIDFDDPEISLQVQLALKLIS